MADTRLLWGAEALWESLHPLLPGLSVEVAASLPSTNTTLLDRARASSQGIDPAPEGEPARVRRSVESGAFGRRAVDWQPCLLVAEQQTAGRGRHGRQWHGEALSSLTFSLALPLAPADWSGLSLAVGVALADALDPRTVPPLDSADQGTAGLPTAPRIGLKWPNDLWLLDAASAAKTSGQGGIGRKLGGVLIETVAAGPRRLAVVGIGLNVRPLALRDNEVSQGLAWLQEIDAALEPPQVLARLARPLVQALLRFEQQGFAAFAAAFAARDLLQGRAISTTHASVPAGTACGVAADGSLLVDTAGGRVQLNSGEVSVRPVGTLRPGAPGVP